MRENENRGIIFPMKSSRVYTKLVDRRSCSASCESASRLPSLIHFQHWWAVMAYSSFGFCPAMLSEVKLQLLDLTNSFTPPCPQIVALSTGLLRWILWYLRAWNSLDLLACIKFALCLGRVFLRLQSVEMQLFQYSGMTLMSSVELKASRSVIPLCGAALMTWGVLPAVFSWKRLYLSSSSAAPACWVSIRRWDSREFIVIS